ncbi:MAG TPA: nuclear transport factor 2 family protein [Thermoanaerobaculia bacterium]|nr:nuclear transport factor 2 family protein [Thermoanaerobaculia bacterium]
MTQTLQTETPEKAPENQGRTADLAALDAELNRRILAGEALDAFDRFYAEDVAMRENSGEPTVGKAANRRREEEFFGSIETLHALELLASAAEGDVTFSEWVFDVTFEGGARKRLEQATVRRWRDGRVVEERFYYDPS